MERNQEQDNSKRSDSKILFKSRKILLPILVFLFIVAVFVHFLLLLIYAASGYVDDLNYCHFNYGKGWEQSFLEDGNYVCSFMQENGSLKLIPVTEEDVESRHCKKKFYNPFYCGV